MKLCRFDGTRFGVVTDAGIHDVTGAVLDLPACGYPYPSHDLLIANLPRLRDAMLRLAEASPAMPHGSVAFDAPVANPGKLVGAPVNYVKHLEEVRDQAALHHNNEAHMRQIREIGLFLKATGSLIGPGRAVEIGKPGSRNDHEVELAVVIGRTCKAVAAEDALDVVAGYAIGLDMTVRGPQDRSLRKSLDTYSVLGPWLVTADEIPDPSSLDLELKVNGEIRQKANTRDLVLSVPELIEFASSYYTLHPGDVIFTGTPEGVSEVRAGDVMEARIDGIGTMTVAVH